MRRHLPGRWDVLGGSVLALGALLLLASCGEGARDGGVAEPVVRDSAGVTIVEAPVPGEGPADRWQVDPEPMVTIGQADGEDPYLLSGIQGVGRLGDGRIWVLDMPTHEVRFFDGEGRFLERVGGQGDGPGEFAMPPLTAFQLPGDTLAVGEFVGRTLNLFGPDGSFLRRVVPTYDHGRRAGWVPSQSCCRPLGMFSDGSWLAAYPEEAPEDAEGVRGTAEIVRLSPEGQVVGRLGRFPGALWYQASPDRPAPVVRGLYTGSVVTAVAGDRLLVGTGSEYRVDELDVEGRLVRSIRVELEPPAFDGEWRQAYEDGYREQVDDGTPMGRALFRDRVDQLPDRLPAYSRILLDPDGRIWLVARTPTFVEPGVERALVLEPDGAVLGRIEFPPGLTVRQVLRDQVVGTRLGEMDVPRVVVHRLVRE